MPRKISTKETKSEPTEQITENLINAADTVINAGRIAPSPEDIQAMSMFPPKGTTAPKIARSMADLDRINPPEEVKNAIYLADGKLLPEWQQVARMYHRPIKKVAIVGFADTKDKAPYNDPTFEIWGLNDLHGYINSIPNGRYDRWFEIHDLGNVDEDRNLMRNRGVAAPDNIGVPGIQKLDVPVYMQAHFDHIPNSIKFPVEEIINSFPYGNYMTNSISYMIALAIYEGFQEIHVYGVDMAVGDEYVAQRPSCEYWLGLAAGRGIKIYIPPASDLLKCACMYAFESRKQNLFESKLDETIKSMSMRQNDIRAQLDNGQRAMYQYEGAIGAIREMKKVWANCGTSLNIKV